MSSGQGLQEAVEAGRCVSRWGHPCPGLVPCWLCCMGVRGCYNKSLQTSGLKQHRFILLEFGGQRPECSAVFLQVALREPISLCFLAS